MQGTWVQTLAQEDPTCCGATKPMRHNYWAWALEPAKPQPLKPARLESMLCNKRSHDNEKPANRNEEYPRSPQLEELSIEYRELEKARAQQRRPNTAKNLKLNK